MAFSRALLARFPPIRYGFLYGSGVMPQEGVPMEGKMIDTIFVVDDAFSWHKENLKKNSSDYSFMKRFGPKAITAVQRCGPGGLYFNPFVPFNDGMIKYGVISYDQFARDLVEWNSLYVAGRLHKPVQNLIEPDEETQDLIDFNIFSAINVASLILKNFVAMDDFFLEICKLSYTGDVRKRFAEDPNKCSKIVKGNYEAFKNLYMPYLETCTYLTVDTTQETIKHTENINVLSEQVLSMPLALKKFLALKSNFNYVHEMKQVFSDGQHPDYVIGACQDMVYHSSLVQTWKGLLSAGPFRSMKYSTAKIKKRIG